MNKKPILTWDECQIIEDEVKYWLEENQDNFTEEEIREKVNNNQFLFIDHWDSLKEELTEIMLSLTKRNYYKDKWIATVNNFGWRNSNGLKEFTASTGEELLREVLPNCDCTFRIYKNGNNGIKIQNFHHDSPTGNEWYYIRPMNKKEVEE